ncbi:hypothetical protein NDU88_002519, partial [Pleurodeles waltl]
MQGERLALIFRDKWRAFVLAEISLYQPPGSKTQFISHGHRALEPYITRENLLTLGDFNLHLEDEGDKDTRSLLDFMTTFDLTQYVESVTYDAYHRLDGSFASHEVRMTVEYSLVV